MDAESSFSPPYNIPWATFLATVEKVAADLPNKIDRSYLQSRSGGEQTYLISAFKGFGLIADNGEVLPVLRELATNADARPTNVSVLLAQFYPTAFQLGQTNSTMGELESAFAEAYPRITGASRTKAIRFFLHAADYAGIAKSPLWKVAKATGGGSRKPRAKSTKSGGDGGAHRETTLLPPTTPKAMKQAYFDLLLEKAKSSDGLDADLLDRIERLLGDEKAGSQS